MYAKVVGNQVVGVSYSLPASHENISGFNNLSPEELREYGYFPLEEVKPGLAFNEVDDGDKDENGSTVYRKVFTQHYGESADAVLVDRVVRTYSIIDLPAQDIKDETNRPIRKRIALIEANQARAVREAALGSPGYLAQIEAQIQALRAKFV